MMRESLSLLVAGRVHRDWAAFDIDSDLMIPADAWRVALGLAQGEPPPDVRPGAPCELRIGDDTVMTGRIDAYDHDIAKDMHSLTMHGRDGAAVLVDCSAPVFVAQQTTLDEIIAKIVRPLGISKVRIDAQTQYTREKINIEPGDTAWNALQHAAEANGLWPWFAPDGTLVVGGPDYSAAPVATLILRRGDAGGGNNIISLRRSEDISDRFSEVTVLGQTHGTAIAAGKHALKATEKDTGVAWHRPKIVTDHEADNEALTRARARKLIADARIRGFTLEAKVQGYRTPGGVLWAPGQRVTIVSEPHGIEGVYFLMGRKFTLSRNGGSVTELRFKEDGVWVLDAHPHKNVHRRGRNISAPKIVDVTK
jgi:prophage tail gpP-like protein